jgi:hypothetical protein
MPRITFDHNEAVVLMNALEALLETLPEGDEDEGVINGLRAKIAIAEEVAR